MAENKCTACGYSKVVADTQVGREVPCLECGVMNTIVATTPAMPPTSSLDFRVGMQGFSRIYGISIAFVSLFVIGVIVYLCTIFSRIGEKESVLLGRVLGSSALIFSLIYAIVVSVGFDQFRQWVPDRKWNYRIMRLRVLCVLPAFMMILGGILFSFTVNNKSSIPMFLVAYGSILLLVLILYFSELVAFAKHSGLILDNGHVVKYSTRAKYWIRFPSVAAIVFLGTMSILVLADRRPRTGHGIVLLVSFLTLLVTSLIFASRLLSAFASARMTCMKKNTE